jgi:hypothetical protein
MARHSNSFRPSAIPTSRQLWITSIFQLLAIGQEHAMFDARRSGAQRGALENNFGQRFSWAPLAFSASISTLTLRQSIF